MGEKSFFKIIIIDDNESIHQDFVKILKTKPSKEIDNLSVELFGSTLENIELPSFEIDHATQGQEGVALISQALDKGIHYALAFVDIRMPPGWDGIETIKHIWELDKDIQVVICTAYSDYTWEETVSHLGKKDNLLILKKPFDTVSVRQLTYALSRKWQLSEEARKYTANLQERVADRTLSLQKSLSLVKSTFESSSDGIIVISNEGSIIDYNQKMVNLLQIPKSILDSKSQEMFLLFLKNALIDPEAFFSQLEKISSSSEETSIDVIKLKNGKIFECYSQPHKLNNKVIGRILDFRDITKRAQLEEELQFQATHDPLTGLGNRLKLLEGMKFAIKAANERGTSFAVVFIDLDRFKLVNDSLSHLTGDTLLKNVAERLRSAIRNKDMLVRLGGDEFVLIFENIRDQKSIINKVNEIIRLFQQPFNVAGREIILTLSIGISFYPNDGSTIESLLRNADAAMYYVKSEKGNNFKLYTPEIGNNTLAIFDQEIELRQAIARQEFFLVYQPEIDLNKEKLVAVEALIRWQHPKKGVLLPINFIPFAEEIGLINAIGEWVIKTACMQNKAWQDKGFPPIRIAVNVSSGQFKQNLVKTVKNALDESGLKPEFLELELTENVILSSVNVMQTINELKKLGVMIAIDDFGSGYSSLSYLHKLPVDRLKIDSSFIQHINTAQDDEVIIRAVIAMAKKLDLEVLAEGVETEEQLNFLKENRCGDVQGYYFCNPLTSEEMLSYLKNTKNIKTITSKMPANTAEE